MSWNEHLKLALSDEGQQSPDVVEEMNNAVMASHARRQIFWSVYDGEKTPGELGLIKNYLNDYVALRARSWQLYKESDIAQIIVKRAVIWIISTGLKLQSEPIKKMFKINGITVDTEEFSGESETRFGIWANSRASDYKSTDTLNKLAKKAYMNTRLGGDVLVIMRPIKGRMTVEIVDGSHVQNPAFAVEGRSQDKGLTVKNGIVQNNRGEHIAYWVREKNNKFTRIKAKTPGGLFTQAFLVYGQQDRLDENRGIPAISVLMENIKKVDRYKDATVGAAEELAKLVYFIVHKEFSTGESPLQQSIIAGLDLRESNPELADDPSQVAAKIAASVEKQVHNLPVGADIKTLDHKGELSYPAFLTANVNMICAAFEIPPEVAMMLYNSNFSASRAALKDWEHTVMVSRVDFSEQFYQHIYTYWLAWEVMQNRIDSPEYLRSVIERDFETRAAFEKARFVGPNVPHIDPLKEVKAVREKLGPLGANIPLTTAERATEEVNGGDFESNAEQFPRELEGFEVESQKDEDDEDDDE